MIFIILLSLSLFIAHEITLLFIGYSMAKPGEDEPDELLQVIGIYHDSDLPDCGKIVLKDDNDITRTIYIHADSAVFDLLKLGDYIVPYNVKRIGKGLAIPLTDLGLHNDEEVKE